MRFFVDFEEEATRNDVTLPAGRVFFSCACWESAAAVPAGMPEGVLDGPEGVQLLTSGGLTIKRNDIRNLWGALGDVMLILGRFSVAPSERGEPAAEAAA